MSGLSREELMPLLESKQAPKTHDGMVTEWFSKSGGFATFGSFDRLSTDYDDFNRTKTVPSHYALDHSWERNFKSCHSVSLLNPQPSNENQDGPSVSAKSKLIVARTLYRQEMSRRATRLVQDHRRRGLSPSVPSYLTTSNTNSSFVLYFRRKYFSGISGLFFWV